MGYATVTDDLNQNAALRIAQFIQTYQSLCRDSDEQILSRKNFNLKDVHRFADALTIVDISAPDFWLIRLSGTKSCERLGQDKTGGNAQASFAEDELRLRRCLAESLFETPSAVRATTRETYANGARALLDTIAVPMWGEENQRLIAHYAQVIEDIEHDFRSRPLADKTDLVSYTFIDLGYGIPNPENAQLVA